jgi:hypothetical protein
VEYAILPYGFCFCVVLPVSNELKTMFWAKCNLGLAVTFLQIIVMMKNKAVSGRLLLCHHIYEECKLKVNVHNIIEAFTFCSAKFLRQ